jgi:hypothetical protein
MFGAEGPDVVPLHGYPQGDESAGSTESLMQLQRRAEEDA